MPKKPGTIRTKSTSHVESMKDKILNEGAPVEKNEEIPPQQRLNIEVNYAEGLDNILSGIFDKERDAHQVILALAQIFEARGHNVPFEGHRFRKICEKIAEIQAAREIAHLFGLGPDHSDKIVANLIDTYFAIPQNRSQPRRGKVNLREGK